MTTERPSRAGLIRSAILYTPLFIATIGGILLMLVGVIEGGPVLLVITLVLAFLFGYQSIQAIRDLRANTTVITQGPVNRIWSKMDMFITRSYYITVDRNIFRIPVQAYWDLREEAKRMRADGSDEDYRIEVRVEHFPHTGNVVKVERLGVVPRATPETTREKA
jgi:hypothetical protein